MPFSRPTLATLKTQAETDLAGSLGLAILLRRSVLAGLARMNAGLTNLLFGHQVWITKQALPDTADTEILQRWASIWGVDRRPSVRSDGPVRFTGTDGFTVPAGSELRRSDGRAFTVDADVLITAGTADATVLAVEAGALGDTTAGADALQFSSALAGVDSGVEVLAPGISRGADLESDDDLRARLVERLRTGARGGSAGDYVDWALEVPNVSRAWALPLLGGPGTVGVTFFVTIGGTAPIPDSGKVAEVQAYIDARRPVTATATVFAPGTQAVNITVALTPNTSAVQAAVTTALLELFDRESLPGGTVYVSRIDEAISTAPGEVDHTMTVPATNIVLPGGTVGVLGSITFV